MHRDGFTVALVGATSLETQEFLALIEGGPFPLKEVLRMGSGESWGSPEELERFHKDPSLELLPPLDPERLGGADFVVLASVPASAREAVLDGTGRGGHWVLELDPEGEGPWADPFGNVDDLRASGPLLRLPDPGALFAALLGRALGPLGPTSLSVQRFLAASSRGEAGVRGLHEQATDLLGFRPPEPGVFGAQVAFNLLPLSGGEGEGGWVRQVASLWPACPPALSAAFLTGVFHGAGLSLTLGVGGDAEEAPRLLSGAFDGHGALRLSTEPPSAVEVAALGHARFTVRSCAAGPVWIWVAYDPLKAGRPAHAARILATLGRG